jgi:hypothetical protein
MIDEQCICIVLDENDTCQVETNDEDGFFDI